MLGFLPHTSRSTGFRSLFLPQAAAIAALELDQPVIPDVEFFDSISVPAGDLIPNGRVTKFLLDLRGADPELHFINARFERNGVVPDAAKYHFDFANEVFNLGLGPGDITQFNLSTYFTEPKSDFVAGVVHSYFLENDPVPIYGIQFYPQDTAREQTILDVARQVKAKIEIPGARFAFVPTGEQQTTSTVGAALTAAGIEIIPLSRILGSIQYISR